MLSLNPELYNNYFRLKTNFDRQEYLSAHYGEWSFSLDSSSKQTKTVSLATTPLSKSYFQSGFQKISSFLSESLEQFLREKGKFSRENCVFLYCNLNEWNLKIKKHNERIDQSKFLNIFEKINPFSFLSFKCQPIDLSALNNHVWQLDLAERNREDYFQALPVPPKQTWSEWYAANEQNYVAHAINKDQVDNVMVSGRVAPSEELFLKAGKVSHEGSYWENHRQVTTTLLHPEIILKMSRITLDTFNLDAMFETGLANYGEVGYSKVHRELDVFSSNESFINRLSTFHILFALNYLSKTPLDEKLSRIYQKAMQNHQESLRQKNLWEEKEPSKLKTDLETLKNTLIKIRCELNRLRHIKILDQVCCTHRRIAWEYGPVVILRGKPDSIISDKENNSIVPDAVELLKPFENGGKFFGLDLFQEDTRIIGPRSLLEKHHPKYGSRIHYIEDLTPEERMALQVDVQAHIKK